MKCPNCLSHDVRRSRRQGPKEGLALRLKGQAPFRCRHCDLRFIDKADDVDAGAAGRPLSFADYLGLRGWARRAFSDHAIIGGVGSVLLVGLIILLFAFSLGWIDPVILRTGLTLD